MNYKNNIVVEKISKERTRRVLEQLAQLKENVSTTALGMLKKTFEFNKELEGKQMKYFLLSKSPIWVVKILR